MTIGSTLGQYRSIIQKAKRKFSWKAVYDLDVQFRMSLSGTAKRLDQIDSTLYTTILDSSAVRAEGNSCQRCKSDHHLARDCSFRTKQTLEERKASSEASTYVSNVSMEIRKLVPQQPRRMQFVPAKSMSTRKKL